jgi:RNA polymerase sigma-70 factor, ECF subfamily
MHIVAENTRRSEAFLALRPSVWETMNVMVQRLSPLDVVLEQHAGAALTFEQVYSSSFNDVARWIRALGGMPADVEDLTQEVFLVVRRKLSAFDGRNLRGWLYRIAQRTVRDYRRRAWFRRVFLGGGSTPDHYDSAVSDNDPSELFERKEAEGLLHALLAQMSDVRRTTFILFEVEGYSGEEIADMQGIPLNTVWTRLHHARKEFLRLVAESGRAGSVK